MKLIYMLSILILFTSINAQAGEWILWEHTTSGSGPDQLETEQPLPLTEHKTLTACLDASKKEAVSKELWAKSNNGESVFRTTKPEGVRYGVSSPEIKHVTYFSIQFRCYPYGVVPTKGNFAPY